MMSAAAAELIDARYQSFENGNSTPVDATLVAQVANRVIGDSTLRKSEDVEKIGRALCAQIGPDADVRAFSRQWFRNGWKLDHTGEVNLCEREDE